MMQQLLGRGVLLEFLLLLDGHVVAEQHHIDVVIQAALRHAGGVAARHGDDGHVQIGE